MTDQEFLDKCAIYAMASIIQSRRTEGSSLAIEAFEYANYMLEKRNNNIIYKPIIEIPFPDLEK